MVTKLYKKIFDINGKLFIADDVTFAIRMFEKVYPFPEEVKSVRLITDSEGSSLAVFACYEDQEPCPNDSGLEGLTANDEMPSDANTINYNMADSDDYPF